MIAPSGSMAPIHEASSTEMSGTSHWSKHRSSCSLGREGEVQAREVPRPNAPMEAERKRLLSASKNAML